MPCVRISIDKLVITITADDIGTAESVEILQGLLETINEAATEMTAKFGDPPEGIENVPIADDGEEEEEE